MVPVTHDLFFFLLEPKHSISLSSRCISFCHVLQVADDSTLYGCCVLVDELVHKPSGLLSVISEKTPSYPSLSRRMLTTRRCYCILSRLPFFELHFAGLNRFVYIISSCVIFLFQSWNVVLVSSTCWIFTLYLFLDHV